MATRRTRVRFAGRESPSLKGRDLTSQFGVLLRDFRQWAGMSHDGLAERSGVDVGTILGFETGEHVVTRVTTVRLLADALELELAEVCQTHVRDGLACCAHASSDRTCPGRSLLAPPLPERTDTTKEAGQSRSPADYPPGRALPFLDDSKP